MTFKNLVPFLVTMFVCTADCFALEARTASDILVKTTLLEIGIAFCVLAYLGINALVIKWFGLFGLCLVVVFDIYLIPALLFMNAN